MRAYLFDIDGTLADLTHRLHHIQSTPKNWDAFFAACPDDAPIPHMIELVQTLHAAGRDVFFVSGRSDRVRAETLAWLDKNIGGVYDDELYMRRDGDHRPDNLVKAEMLDQIRAEDFEPIMAFDDRDQVVKMWREKGIPCVQVAEGAF
jgi:phosphoglycolate phosphatase-like HAD superfamily hydrolase